jgi:hypothetical protein
LSNIPPNIKNEELYRAYLSLLKRVINNHQSLIIDLWKIKESRNTLAYDPSLRFFRTSITKDSSVQDASLNGLWVEDDILLHRIIIL